jgi:HSP20 family protein
MCAILASERAAHFAAAGNLTLIDLDLILMGTVGIRLDPKGNLMALVRWEPVPMNRLINSFFDTPTVPSASTARRFVPATDLVETDTHYVLRADLPGVSEDDISVDVENNLLTVRGERRSEQETTKAGYRRQERTSGSFRRSLRLPQGVDADAIAATFDRGVLEISVPKPEQPQPKRVEITVGAPAAAIEQETEAGAEAPAAS